MRDPIEFAGGDPNLFRYVRNSPTNWFDSNGLQQGTKQTGGAFGGTTNPLTLGSGSPIISASSQGTKQTGGAFGGTTNPLKLGTGSPIDSAQSKATPLNSFPIESGGPSGISEKEENCRKFKDWYKIQGATGWTSLLPDCPCSIKKTIKRTICVTDAAGGALVNVTEDRIANPNPTRWDDPSGRLLWFNRNFRTDYHPGATYDMRSSKSYDGHGQQCTYDANGKLITHGFGAGTADYYAQDTILGFYSHQVDDVAPWEWALACDGGTPGKNVELYIKARPTNQGKGPDGKKCPTNP